MSALDDLKRKNNLDSIEYAIVHYAFFGGKPHSDSAIKAASELATLRLERDALRAELSEYRTLRPAACNRNCFERGWKAAQEAAAKVADVYRSDAAEHRTRDGELCSLVSENIGADIRALQPQANCDGCNPLEPDAVPICYCGHHQSDHDSGEFFCSGNNGLCDCGRFIEFRPQPIVYK